MENNQLPNCLIFIEGSIASEEMLETDLGALKIKTARNQRKHVSVEQLRSISEQYKNTRISFGY